MSSTVLRYAEWTIGPERDADGHLVAPSRQVRCATCAGASPSGTEQADTDTWAMRHTGLTGHRCYREMTTAPLIVRPAPTNPLHEQEAR